MMRNLNTAHPGQLATQALPPNGISGKPKAIPLEEAVRGHGMKFKSEEEMKKAIERLKKQYSNGPIVPLAPESLQNLA
jgi:hypothetical protein